MCLEIVHPLCASIFFKSVSVTKICILIGRAYAEAASSVKLEEELHEEEAAKDANADSDSIVESGSSDEDDESSEGKKKKQRVGFRDRKVMVDMTSRLTFSGRLSLKQICIRNTNLTKSRCLNLARLCCCNTLVKKTVTIIYN